MAPPTHPEDVMAFLTARGLSATAAALHEDLLSLSPRTDAAAPVGSASVDRSGDGHDLELEDGHSLPPLRLPSSGRDESRGHVAAAAAAAAAMSAGSSSPDAFLSLASSPSEPFNPYASWSPVPAPSEAASSGRYSEFGTAREYNNYWCDEHFSGYQSEDSSGNYLGEDKFVLPIDAAQRSEKQQSSDLDEVDHKDENTELGGSCEDCAEICSSPFPVCSSCKGLKRKSSWGSSTTIYGRYRVLDDQTERLEDCELGEFQMNRIDAKPKAVAMEAALLRNQDKIEDGESLLLGLVEELHMLNPFGLDTDQDTAIRKIAKGDFYEGKTSIFRKTDNDELQKNEQRNNHIYTIDACLSEDSITTTEVGDRGILDKEEKTEDELEFYNHQEEFEVFNLRIVHRKNRTGFEENREFKIILNSVVAGRYYITDHLGTATFSKVVQARDLHTGVDVCLKIIKNNKDFLDQSLDEIKLLKLVNKHDPADEHHLLRLYDYFYHQEHVFIVTELLRANLYELQKYNSESACEEYYTLSRIQSIAQQCLEALEYLHTLRIIHCDLKPENILIKNYSKCEIKVIDLGSSCFETDSLSLYVQSRSYRSPEVILGLPYDHKIDIWSLGCILAELYTGDVLFPNDSVQMILARMIGILGPIDMEMLILGTKTDEYFTENYDLYHTNEETDQIEYLIPERSSLAQHLQAPDDGFVDFVSYLLQINAKWRPTANEALLHPWLSFSYQ